MNAPQFAGRAGAVCRAFCIPLVVLPLFASAAAVQADASRPNIIVVTSTIQAAVDAANPGDIVRVPPGTYHENVLVTKDEITIEGDFNAVLDGTGLAGNSGITVTSSAPPARIHGFRLTGLRIQNYAGNGVILIGVDNFEIDRGAYVNNEEYGIFPIHSSHGSIVLNRVSGSNDTGIYIGQSTQSVIQENFVTDCTVGIDVENSTDIVVQKNKLTRNSIGMTTEVIPGLTDTVTDGVKISGNVLSINNRPNPVTDPTDFLSQLPSGSGLLIVGAEHVIVEFNSVRQNNSVGIALTQLPPALAALDPRINPFPDNDQIRGNIVRFNGSNPDPRIAPFPPSDLIWDLSGTNDTWDNNIYRTSFPPTLPGVQRY